MWFCEHDHSCWLGCKATAKQTNKQTTQHLHDYLYLPKLLCHHRIKGKYFRKALTCMNFIRYKQKMIFLRRRIPLATLLYEQFIHLTYVIIRPNIQLFSNTQHAYISVFLESLPGLLSSAMLRQAVWTLEKRQLHEDELQLSDYNI